MSLCLCYLCVVCVSSRDIAFLSLGQLSMAVGSAILPELPTLLEHVSRGLQLGPAALLLSAPTAPPSSTSLHSFRLLPVHSTSSPSSSSSTSTSASKKKKTQFTNTALTCVGMMARALGEQMLPHIDSLVGQ